MSWLKPRPREQHVLFMKEMSQVCAALGGPLCAGLNDLMQKESFRELVEFDIDYERGYSYSDYCYARQILALVEKQGFLDLGYDKKGAAVSAFLAAERKCQATNERLGSQSPEKDVSAVLHYAMQKISDVLGPEIPELESLSFLFGPGATTNVKGKIANSRRKLSTRMACSEELLPHVGEFLSELPIWASQAASSTDIVVDGDLNPIDTVWNVPVDVSCGKLHFVPKNSKTYRPICVEPVLNSLFQKGIGTYLKNRLKKSGVNLFDQSRNQDLARIGSEKGNLCTIDLKSASDTVSLGLVFHLLPFHWAEFLSRCRTGRVEYDGYILELEKFSSMGNGYTFELESLIFFGLMDGVRSYLLQTGALSESQDTRIGVYGDDLIIPTCGYELAIRTLAYCGFDANPKKSFACGPFRESCGADFFLGNDLRPFYLRKELSDQVLFSFHNWAVRHGEREIARLCLRWTRRKLRIWGPDRYGDGHLVGSYFLRLPRKFRRCGYEGGYFDTYVCRPKRDLHPLPGDVIFPAYAAYSGMSREMPCDPNVIRGVQGYVKKAIYTMDTGVLIQ